MKPSLTFMAESGLPGQPPKERTIMLDEVVNTTPEEQEAAFQAITKALVEEIIEKTKE